MCFDYKEYVVLFLDLRRFLENTYNVKKNKFETDLKKFLLDRFEPNDHTDTLISSVDRFSMDQPIKCTINFLIKCIILSENAKCVYCSTQGIKMRKKMVLNKFKERSDLDLKLKLKLIDNSKDERNQKLLAQFSQLKESSKLTFLNKSNNSNNILQMNERDFSTIIYRCSDANCLPCSTMSNLYRHASIPNLEIPSIFYKINILKFQDLQLSGIFIEQLDQNMICKDFYDLLIHKLKWSFKVVDAKMANKFDHKIVDRKLLTTRLPITLPVKLKMIKSNENHSDDANRSIWIKFYYDPCYFISHNVFGRNLLNKLKITINLKKLTFSFENSDLEFKLESHNNHLHENLASFKIY